MQRAHHVIALPIFIATICTSAFLLFSVQPMFAKMVLPTLGGAPAVWAVSLCFFQVMLVAGYGYAHLLERYLAPKLALVFHLALLALALAALPIGLPAISAAAAPDRAYLWLITILCLGVGLPFFALSANAPLLQAWFGRSGHIESSDAYFLYAASNAGSLTALLAYPLLIEPLLGLTTQSRIWAVGFVLLGALIAACGWSTLRELPARATAPRKSPADLPGLGFGNWKDRLTWAGLSFIPSGLLVALTTFVTTDIAAVPLLWVVPLALYLGTFIVAFQRKPPISRRFLLGLQPVAVAITIATMDWDAGLAWAISCLAGIAAFLATSLLCHRQLYERRPGAERLTEFYLWMSIGGSAGGIFSALIAPQIFTNLLEFPLLLGLGMLCRFGGDTSAVLGKRWPLVASTLAALAVLVVVITTLTRGGMIVWTPQMRVSVLAGLGMAMVVTYRWITPQLVATAALVLGAVLLPDGNKPIHVARTFFGTHRVIEPPGAAFRILLHGTTLHGAQRIADYRLTGTRPLPLTYYHPTGPLAQGLRLARAAAGAPSQPLRVGIVGLGAGAMACHAISGERWRFFEIDPEVVRIATNPVLFSYLGICQPDAEFIVGDARLTLAGQAEASFDYLLVDAFSSDAIPVHLLTVEALRLYAGHLSDRGVLAIHVSNQNLDLPPIVESNLARIPELRGVYTEGESRQGAIRSQVVLIARHDDILAPALTWHKARVLGAPSVRPWLDDYSDVLSPLIRRYRAKLAAD
jgi:hypothetical protein